MTLPLHQASIPFPLRADEAFHRLHMRPGCVWLDSSRINPQADGRWSLLAVEPVMRLRLCDNGLTRIDYTYGTTPHTSSATPHTYTPPLHARTTPLHDADPLDALEQMLTQFGGQPICSANTGAPAAQAADAFAQPFFGMGGAIGYFSYEFGRRWEPHAPLTTPTPGFPLMDWAFYRKGILFDHANGSANIIACSTHSDADAHAQAEAFLQDILHSSPQTHTPSDSDADLPDNPQTDTFCDTSANLQANATCDAQKQNAYMRAVEQTRAYIASGDIYQTNIAQFFSAPLQEAPASLYLRLRALNPAPYAAYIDTGEYQILSSSPELFLQKRAQHIRTRPIKGTRPRGKTQEQDARNQAELLASEKERAELLMIVDLERNDLGRVCATGSVKVDALYRIESYATVHHLVADVSGSLSPGTTLRNLMRATFPGGSITGAPKVRSMQIIDELEQRQRGIFCGAIGVIGLDGSLDLNIAIRTLLCAPQADDAPRQTQPAVTTAPNRTIKPGQTTNPGQTAMPEQTAITEQTAMAERTEKPERGERTERTANPERVAKQQPPPTQLTTEATPGRCIHLGVGSGIVWDSSPLHEYEETLHKTEAIQKAIRSQKNAPAPQ